MWIPAQSTALRETKMDKDEKPNRHKQVAGDMATVEFQVDKVLCAVHSAYVVLVHNLWRGE
jgi:hypothetical protein